MRVLVAFHFNKPLRGRLAWQTDVEVSLEGSYEDIVDKILQQQQGLSRFLGEDWTAIYPFHVLWLSHDHHGNLLGINKDVPPFQSHLRKKNWRQVLGMMEQRGFRDVIQVEIEEIKERVGTPGREVECNAMVEWEAEGNRTRKARVGNNPSTGTTVADSSSQTDRYGSRETTIEDSPCQTDRYGSRETTVEDSRCLPDCYRKQTGK